MCNVTRCETEGVDIVPYIAAHSVPWGIFSSGGGGI